MSKVMVCVGAPFSEQTFYGPFECFSDADEWCVENCKHDEFTWITTLHSPNEVNDGKAKEVSTRSS